MAAAFIFSSEPDPAALQAPACSRGAEVHGSPLTSTRRAGTHLGRAAERWRLSLNISHYKHRLLRTEHARDLKIIPCAAVTTPGSQATKRPRHRSQKASWLRERDIETLCQWHKGDGGTNKTGSRSPSRMGPLQAPFQAAVFSCYHR